jgi:ABC-2 type transport system permease protein
MPPPGTAYPALFYLWYTSARNRLRAQRGRLKQPRYLLALVFGGLYIWWVLQVNRRDPEMPIQLFTLNDAAHEVVAAVVLLSGVRWWFAKPDRGALAFTPAEVHLLFPAPVSRSALIHSKLLRAQTAILLNVLIWSLLLRGAATGGWQRGIALWILLSTFSLHRLAAAIIRLNAAQHRVSALRRVALPVGIFAAMCVVVLGTLLLARDTITQSWTLGFQAVLTTMDEALRQPVAAVALAPVSALIAPLFAQNTTAWLLALGPALAVLLLHYVWVIRTDAAFEEAALDAAEERVRRLAALSGTQAAAKRSARGGIPWIPPLPRRGHPAITMAWKNMAAAIRGGGWLRQNGVIVLIFAATLAVLRISTEMPMQAVYVLSGVWGMMLLVVGPTWTRFDLRLDLRDVATVRALPLSGRAVVTADVVGVALLHSVSVLVFFVVPLTFALLDPATRGALLAARQTLLPTVGGVLLLIVSTNLLTFSIQNALAVSFPAWVQLGADRRGVEALGQTMLTVGATLLTSAVLMVFPVLIGTATLYIATAWWGVWGFPVAMSIGTLVLLAELLPLWHGVGDLLESLEPSDVPGQRS